MKRSQTSDRCASLMPLELRTEESSWRVKMRSSVTSQFLSGEWVNIKHGLLRQAPEFCIACSGASHIAISGVKRSESREFDHCRLP